MGFAMDTCSPSSPTNDWYYRFFLCEQPKMTPNHDFGARPTRETVGDTLADTIVENHFNDSQQYARWERHCLLLPLMHPTPSPRRTRIDAPRANSCHLNYQTTHNLETSTHPRIFRDLKPNRSGELRRSKVQISIYLELHVFFGA